MTFRCSRHPEAEAVLVSGYNYCIECSRALEREIILQWAHHIKPECTWEKTLKILQQMFGSATFGLSDFPRLYAKTARIMMQARKGDFGFVEPQSVYLQKAFLEFIGEKYAFTSQGTLVLVEDQPIPR